MKVEPVSGPLAYRILDAATRLGVGRTTLYDLIKAGEIKTIKIGGRTLVPDSELQKAISSRLEGVA